MARRSKQSRRVPKRLGDAACRSGWPQRRCRNAAADAARQEMEFWLKLLERIRRRSESARPDDVQPLHSQPAPETWHPSVERGNLPNERVCVSGDFASAQNPFIKNEFERNQFT